MGRLGIAGRSSVPDAAAGLLLTLAVAGLLLLVGAPIATSDFWFHARIGETYATEGPWPAAEPLLHTAHEDAPVQHEWLFGVGVYGLERAVGLQGVRVAHVLAVLAILWLVASLLRRESGSKALAAALTLVFIALAWRRLIQFRPDLVSIPAALLLFRLLLERDALPSWRRVGAACLLCVVWANAHSLFGIGPALLIAALLGVALRELLSRWPTALAPLQRGSPGAGPSSRRLAGRLAAALLLICVTTLLNPRGVSQHLTFFTSSSDFGIWAIADEWSPFTPFDYSALARGNMTSWLAWLLADAIMLGWVAAVLWGFGRRVLRRSAESLRRVDPVLLGLGLSGIVAVLVSVRFLWMLIFTLLFLVRAFATRKESGTGRAIQDWGAVALSLGLLLAFPTHGGVRERVDRLSLEREAYFERAWSAYGVHESGVRFLAETELEGNLYNRYTMGGFLAYHLAPRLRTFIDGRTEHYPPEVLSDYFRIANQAEVEPGETSLEALERRDVDIYFGVGLPVAGENIYTTTRLERAPDWILVFRTPGDSIYLRKSQRNRENLRRVESFYARANVPFDRERGLVPDRVVREAAAWAIDAGVLPEELAAWSRDRESDDPELRYRALDAMGRTFALFGAYAEQIRIDREASESKPRELAPRRRLVFGLLHSDQPAEALKAARGLRLMGRTDSRSATFLSVAQEYANQRESRRGASFARARDRYVERRRAAGGASQREEGWLVPLEATLQRLPLLTPAEMEACCLQFY
jgi:hypothetical protein